MVRCPVVLLVPTVVGRTLAPWTTMTRYKAPGHLSLKTPSPPAPSPPWRLQPLTRSAPAPLVCPRGQRALRDDAQNRLAAGGTGAGRAVRVGDVTHTAGPSPGQVRAQQAVAERSAGPTTVGGLPRARTIMLGPSSDGHGGVVFQDRCVASRDLLLYECPSATPPAPHIPTHVIGNA